MRFWCPEHGDISTASASGNSLGYRTNRHEPDQHDLGGIVFVFENTDGGVVIKRALNMIEGGAKDATNYLEKFNNWREIVINAFVEGADAEDRSCQGCGEPVLILEDDEEPPERLQ